MTISVARLAEAASSGDTVGVLRTEIGGQLRMRVESPLSGSIDLPLAAGTYAVLGDAFAAALIAGFVAVGTFNGTGMGQ